MKKEKSSVIYRSPTVTSSLLHYPSGTHDFYSTVNLSSHQVGYMPRINYQPEGVNHATDDNRELSEVLRQS